MKFAMQKLAITAWNRGVGLLSNGAMMTARPTLSRKGALPASRKVGKPVKYGSLQSLYANTDNHKLDPCLVEISGKHSRACCRLETESHLGESPLGSEKDRKGLDYCRLSLLTAPCLDSSVG